MKATVGVCAILFVAVTGLAHAAEPAKGDVVWAEWKTNDWYKGKVTEKKDGTFSILFDDGDKATVKAGQIALDQPPTAEQAKAGTVVLAKWTDGKLYPGKIAKVKKEGQYDIKFDDGDELTVELKDMRLVHFK